MQIDYQFRSFQRKDLDRLARFLLSQELGYPNYSDWVHKSMPQVLSGEKQALLAYSNGVLVADTIFQEHRQLNKFMEIKNMRVIQSLRMRAFGGFMLKQVEREARELGYNAMICDAREDQNGIIEFLAINGFLPIATLSLYEDRVRDVTMVKFLGNSEEQREGIIKKASNCIFSLAV